MACGTSSMARTPPPWMPTRDNAEAERLARESESVQRHVGDKRIVKVIVVPGRLVNVVAK